MSKAGSALLSAARESPGDVQLVEVAAKTLREQPTPMELADTDSATVADRLMDELVASDPQNVAARLARYRYRSQYKLADAAGDLEAALAIEPNNINAIVLSAFSVMEGSPTEDQLKYAESVLRRAIVVAP